MDEKEKPAVFVTFVNWVIVAILAIWLAWTLWAIWSFKTPALVSGDSDTSEPPNLYELTRQTAENTRHIFWLIVVCFAAWSFRSYKTGK